MKMPSKCPCCRSNRTKKNPDNTDHLSEIIKKNESVTVKFEVVVCANCGILYDRKVQEYWENHKPKITANPIEEKKTNVILPDIWSPTKKEEKKLLEIPAQ